MSLFAALPMLLGVPSGRLVDRIGVRAPLLVSAAVVAAAIALPAVFPGLISLYFAAAGVGTGFMLFHIARAARGGRGQRRAGTQGELRLARARLLGVQLRRPSPRAWRSTSSAYRATFLMLTGFALAALLLLVTRRGRLTHTPTRGQAARRRHARPAAPARAAARVRDDGHPRQRVGPVRVRDADLRHGDRPFGLHHRVHPERLRAATFLVRRRCRGCRATCASGRRSRSRWRSPASPMRSSRSSTTVPLLAAIAFLLGLGLGATQPSIMSLLYSKAPRAARAKPSACARWCSTRATRCCRSPSAASARRSA